MQYESGSRKKVEAKNAIHIGAKPDVTHSRPQIQLTPKRAFQVLMSVSVLLIVISFGGTLINYLYESRDAVPPRRLARVLELIDVGLEANIPTWFATATLLLCSLLLAAITATKTRADFRRHWGALAFIFGVLSIDEAGAIHDGLSSVLRETLNTSGFLYLAWVIPALIFLALFVIFYVPFIRALPSEIHHLFLISGGLYVAGAVGLEMISAYYGELPDRHELVYAIIWTVEEFVEMVGIALFIYTLLRYMRDYMQPLTIYFEA